MATNDKIRVMSPEASKIPEGPVAEKWTNFKAHQKLVNPANKRKLDIIVVGTGLAGASAASTLAEMGFNVLNFCIQDSPRRAHSIAAQGGINAAKNYQNDGDSVYRLFYDTVKGGAFSPTAPSAAHRYPAHSTPRARQASSSCSAHTRPSTARSRPARSRASTATRCTTWCWSRTPTA